MSSACIGISRLQRIAVSDAVMRCASIVLVCAPCARSGPAAAGGSKGEDRKNLFESISGPHRRNLLNLFAGNRPKLLCVCTVCRLDRRRSHYIRLADTLDQLSNAILVLGARLELT